MEKMEDRGQSNVFTNKIQHYVIRLIANISLA